MLKEFAKLHTITYVVNIVILMMSYILNWKAKFVPEWLAFIVAALLLLTYTSIWYCYKARDALIQLNFARIIRSIPKQILFEMINERDDVVIDIDKNRLQ